MPFSKSFRIGSSDRYEINKGQQISTSFFLAKNLARFGGWHLYMSVAQTLCPAVQTALERNSWKIHLEEPAVKRFTPKVQTLCNANLFIGKWQRQTLLSSFRVHKFRLFSLHKMEILLHTPIENELLIFSLLDNGLTRMLSTFRV